MKMQHGTDIIVNNILYLLFSGYNIVNNMPQSVENGHGVRSISVSFTFAISLYSFAMPIQLVILAPVFKIAT